MSRNSVTFRIEDAKGYEPLILIFAPSERSPAYEGQVQLLLEEKIPQRCGARLVRIFCDGDSYLDEEKLDDASAEQLRTEYGVGEDDFLIVLIGRDGAEKRRDDAPLQPAVVLERISDGGRAE